jgi:gliding motility-associated-like protein
MKKLYPAILCLLLFSRASGQAFSPPVGIATVVGPGVFNLTPTTTCGYPYYAGAVWCTTTIDFTNGFVLTYKASSDHSVGTGADGICVSFGQNYTPTSLNGTNAFLGYYHTQGGPPNPDFVTSFGIEFDNFDNSFNPYMDDPPGIDHTAICLNAVPTTPLAGPVAISPFSPNIKDGLFHDYRIEWCPPTHTLKVFCDDSLRLSSVYDYAGVFTTPTAVHWGFSGGTGAACSNQIVKEILLTPGLCSSTNPCLKSSLIINTGYDPTTGLAVPPVPNLGVPMPGHIDPHWKVTDIAAPTNLGIIAAGSVPVTIGANADVVETYSGGWAVFSGLPGQVGNWIHCNNANYYDTDPTTYGPDDYTETFARSFHMCSADTVLIDIHIANDNYNGGIWIDGNPPYYSQPSPGIPGCVSSFLSAPTTMYLAAGWHTINVKVVNYNNVFTFNYGGLGIWGSVSSVTGSYPFVSETDTTCSCAPVIIACDSIALPDSLHPCVGDVITLPATLYGPDSILSIAWTPITGLSSSTILNPTLTATSSGWYHITVQSIIPYNLVANGDFSAGNAGFTSSYTYSAPPSTVLNEGFYSVYTNPNGVHTGFTSMGDHTTGTGNMMILNGGPTPTDVWCQTISVTPNTDYDFSAWIANCSSVTIGPDVPILQFKINGVLIGTPVTISTLPGTWMNFFQAWNSGTSTSATICIYDLNTSAAGNDFAIDDISFRQLCTAKDSIYIAATIPDTTHNFKDTSVCILSSPFTLNAPGGYSSYIWNTGSTGTSISAGTAGIYWVTATAPCRLMNDTFNVSFFVPDTTFRHDDTVVCASVGTVTINAPSGYTTYLWNTGATSSSVSVGSGRFWVQATRICTILEDTIKVKFNIPPPVELGNDTSFCKGNSVTLTSAEPPGTQYSWSTGSTAPSIIVSQGGTYFLTATLNGCSTTDSIKLTEEELPTVDLGPDTFLCKGDQMYLTANSPNSTVVWNSGSVTQNITVIETGTYWVTVSTACGDVTDSINVEFDPCDINFPSAFTPNGDGKNDVIRVLGYLRLFRDFSLSIYNRWGQRVYFSEDIYGGWDGVFNGTKQDLGTYFYMIKYSLHSKHHMLKGDFQLIR